MQTTTRYILVIVSILVRTILGYLSKQPDILSRFLSAFSIAVYGEIGDFYLSLLFSMVLCSLEEQMQHFSSFAVIQMWTEC